LLYAKKTEENPVLRPDTAIKIMSSAPTPPWQDITTVLLDMDGTLLDLHYDNHFWLHYVPRCYAETHDMAHDEAHDKLMARYSEVRGSLDWYCIDFWTRELGLDIEKLKYEIAEKIAIRPDVERFLLWLNEHGKRVVMVTNAHPASLKLKMDRTKLHVHFDRIINSHDLGMAKEHAGFWDKLQTVEPYLPQSTMLIDDNLDVLDCAHQYGIQYCYGIVQPDSQQSCITSEHYPLVDTFRGLLPE
jgi:HAD superfamily hydrolase (TIGR01509 family)